MCIPPDRNSNSHNNKRPASPLDNNNRPLVRRRQEPENPTDAIHTILFNNFPDAVGESRPLFSEHANDFSNETLENTIQEELRRFSNVLSQAIIIDERTNYVDTPDTRNIISQRILNFLREELPQDLNQQIEENRPETPPQATDFVNEITGDIWEHLNLEILSRLILNAFNSNARSE